MADRDSKGVTDSVIMGDYHHTNLSNYYDDSQDVKSNSFWNVRWSTIFGIPLSLVLLAFVWAAFTSL